MSSPYLVPEVVFVLAAITGLAAIAATCRHAMGSFSRPRAGGDRRPAWLIAAGLVAYVVAWLVCLIGLAFFLTKVIEGSLDGRVDPCYAYDTSAGRWEPVMVLGLFGVLGDLGVCGALARRSVNLFACAAPFTLLMGFLFWLLWSVLGAIGAPLPSRC